MRIERVELNKASLESFCDDNMLTVVITEFESRLALKAGKIEYKANLKDFYLQRTDRLEGVGGYGTTEEEALKQLAENISTRVIANGMGDDAVIIEVPKIISVWNKSV